MLAVYKLYGYKHLLATTTLAVSSSHAKSGVFCKAVDWHGCYHKRGIQWLSLYVRNFKIPFRLANKFLCLSRMYFEVKAKLKLGKMTKSSGSPNTM